MNFEKTYRIAKEQAKALMKQGNIPAYIRALHDLKDLQRLRAIGLQLRQPLH